MDLESSLATSSGGALIVSCSVGTVEADQEEEESGDTCMSKSLTTTTEIKAWYMKKVVSGDETMRGDVINTSQFPTVHDGGGRISHGTRVSKIGCTQVSHGPPRTTKGRVSKDAT